MNPTASNRLPLAALLAAAILAASALVAAANTPARAGSHAAPPGAAEYDLGEVAIPEDGPKGPLPVRLWGAIAVPDGPGPHPVVLVAHGRHANGCPGADFDSTEWPCFEVEQRNDLGMRHVVEAIAARGAIAISPDLNGAYTGGWGEPDDRSRFTAIVDLTMGELEAEEGDPQGRFGVELGGRVDRSRLGLLGHSRSGQNVVRYARAAPGVDALFLLAPAAEEPRLPDLPTAIVLAACDGDVGAEGRRFLARARRDRDRSAPVFLAELARANHNYFNSTLAELGVDDSIGTGLQRCRPQRRLGAGAQQRWLDRPAADFFAAELDDRRRPRWLRPRGRLPERLYGRRVDTARFPGR